MLAYLKGAHFHPPAGRLLPMLPTGATLILDPEPDNPYDPNAVRVLIEPHNVSDSTEALIREACPDFGLEPDEVFSAPIMLGYIAKESAGAWAKRLDGQQGGASLSHDLSGAPMVRWESP